MNELVKSTPPTDVIISTDSRDASLSAAFSETEVMKAAAAKLALQLRTALAMVEICRERGNMTGAWLHLRMAESILTEISPEPPAY